MRLKTKKRQTKVRNMLSSNIRHIRKSLKLNQNEFSELVGISVTSISNYENGKVIPSLRTLNKIAAAAGKKANVLFEER